MASKKPTTPISHLACREAQAPLVASLIRAYEREMGEKAALEVVREVIRRDAAESGRRLAEDRGGGSLQVLLGIVEDVWAAEGAMEVANLELTESTLTFDVTMCGYADMYKRLCLKDLGYLLSCERDFVFLEGFNPGIRLERTTTIMEGADRCDFRYRIGGP